jgi:hypothetical protein
MNKAWQFIAAAEQLQQSQKLAFKPLCYEAIAVQCIVCIHCSTRAVMCVTTL